MANVLVEETSLTNIANAIRSKNGTTTTYKPGEMASAINNIQTNENLSTELTEQDTLINNQEIAIDDIMLVMQNIINNGGGEVVTENLFSNDYSQIGYGDTYITSNGYTLTNILWSDLTPYTGQTVAWYVTNPIEIKSDTWYKYEGFSSGNNPAACFLGADQTTIYNGFVYKGSGKFLTPKNAKYIVMTVARTNMETMSVIEMTEAEINEYKMESLINRTIVNYSSDTLTSVGNYAFHSCTSLTTVNLPQATSLGTSAFNNCTAMTSIEIPLVQSITTQTFYACHSLENLIMPSLKTIGAQGVRNCNKLTIVDVGVCTSIGALSFENCPKLNAVIIRTSSVCSLANVSAFTGTLIASGTGYIYVPDSLIDSYKSATNWSTYANQIRPIGSFIGGGVE